MNVAMICVGLLGLLLFGLGFCVSLARRRTSTSIGNSQDPTELLHKLVRAHGNTAEYAPMLALLMVVLGTGSPATWVLWCMGAAVVSRYLIAAGLIVTPTLERPHPMRFVGALGTYVTGLLLSIAVLAG